MTTIQSIRKTLTDPTPFYAAVGFVDKAVDQVRTASDDATKKAADLSSELKPEQLRDRAQELPKRVEAQGKAAFAQAEQSYTGLSKRGAGVVAELRKQREAQTQELVNQGKATAASARKAVLTGRKEAAKQVAAAAGSVEGAADKLGDEARTEVRSTASRAGQTTTKKTTAKKRPARKSTAKKAPAKSTAKTSSTTSNTSTTSATATKAADTKA